ncbi:MAG: PKD domain-containing protein [Ktedonobacteraceae bacterium]
MQEPTVYAGTPAPGPGGVPPLRRRVSYVLLPILVIALIVAGMSWLQWAAQRGLALGYPLPNVQITSPTIDSTLKTNTPQQFSAQASGRDLSYSWDFGDQGSGSGPDVSHAYASNGNFTVTVTVTDGAGHTSTSTISVAVAPPPPTATFTYTVGYYYYVSFDASGSVADGSTSISNYNWDFGDGATDSTTNPLENHTYSSAGTYTVTLNVTDATGQASSSYQVSISVS